MSADTFQIRQGDTLPVLRYQLLGSNGVPADLTSATAVFRMQPAFGGTLKVSAAASVVPVMPVSVVTKTLFSNIATLGTATSHGLTPGTTAVVGGVDSTFNGTWEVTSTPTPTTFTYLLGVSSPNIPAQVATGTVSVPGVVSYSWASGDTDTIGSYAGSFVVTFTGGATQTFPSGSDSYIPIAVTQAVPAAHGLRAGPCLPWTDADAVRECVGGIDPMQDIDSWIEAASQILYALTGCQYKGLCIATIRPGHQECTCGWGCGAHAWGWPFGGAYGYGPFGLPGWSWGWGWGRGGGGSQNILLCASQIDLGADARQVLSVTIDGQTVDPATYRLDPRGKLVRQPDAAGNMLIWPCCSRTDTPSGQPGTFEITYAFGMAPPESVVMADNQLAGQFALACNPGTAGQCKLPQHVQTMTRQGVTATFITDVTTILSKGFTGLPIVDLVIQSVNPHHLMRRSRVVSIDIEPHRLMGNP